MSFGGTICTHPRTSFPDSQGVEICLDCEVSIEQRPVAPSVMRPMAFHGRHDPQCRKDEHGWVCVESCTVEDVPTTDDFKADIEKHGGFSDEARRRFLFVYWEVWRTTTKYTYVNGRTRSIDIELILDSVASGRTLTKRGALRKVERAEIRDAL